MLVPLQYAVNASHSAHSLQCTMTFHLMRHGHLGTFPHSHRRKEILACGDRFFHEVDRSQILAKIIEVKVKDIIWESIIYWFGLPWTIIIDNGWQFCGHKLARFCQDLGVT